MHQYADGSVLEMFFCGVGAGICKLAQNVLIMVPSLMLPRFAIKCDEISRVLRAPPVSAELGDAAQEGRLA